MVNDLYMSSACSRGRTLGKPGENDGFSRGLVGQSALSEGIIQDVILGLNEVMGEIEINL